MNFTKDEALLHLLWLGAAVDDEIALKEWKYIKAVRSLEEIQINLDDFFAQLDEYDSIERLSCCLETLKHLPLKERSKYVIYLFEMLLADDKFLDVEDQFFQKVREGLGVTEEQFRHAAPVTLSIE